MVKKFGRSKLLFPAALTLFSMVLSTGMVTTAHADGDVRLQANEPKAAAHGTLLGHKADSEKLQITLSLKPHNAAQLDAFIADLYNPASPNYKQFLTPEQFATQFGPSAADVAQVTGFAKAAGLSVESVTADNTLVQVSGTAAKLERAFGVTLNNYQNASGQVYYANDQAPALPAAVSNVLNGVLGLDNEPHWHHAGRESAPLVKNKPGSTGLTPYVGSGPAGGYTPSELRGAYDVNPLITSNINGTGQTVALFELDGFVASNVSTYVSYYGLGSPAPTTVLVDGYSGAAGAGQVEVELDIEVVNAIAPKANTKVYEGPNTDQGVIDTYQKIATDNIAKVISVSWGQCEQQSTTATMNSMHTIFQQYATQGQSIFVASGDSGAYDCSTMPSTLAVDSPANDPYVTGVGGTNLALSSGGYGSESVWSNSTNSTGGGGGLSTIYAKPSWQVGPGTTNSYSNGKRQVPDVSADADPASGYSIYSQAKWTVVGGTSAAAPLWAGIAALNNHYASTVAKGNLGQANPTLYNVFNSTQTYPAFHDVTSGSNLYYPATTGYDMASGIGTPDAYNLIRDINGASSGGGGGGGTATELISNGGFESGTSPWTQSSSGGYQLIDTTRPHTGSYSAYLCGYNNCTDTIYQTVSIPATATKATLTFWAYVSTTETTHPWDYLYVQLRNTSGTALTTLTTLNDGTASGWVQYTYDVTSYKGQSVQVYFKGTNDVSNPTSFFVDDVSLKWQ